LPASSQQCFGVELNLQNFTACPVNVHPFVFLLCSCTKKTPKFVLVAQKSGQQWSSCEVKYCRV